MKKLNFLVSLTNDDNDYQQEQASAAQQAAKRLGVDIAVVHAQQRRSYAKPATAALHPTRSASSRPDAIIFEPASGTAFPQVARAATAADIGWVVLNHDPDYLSKLRLNCHVPVFSISSDHDAVGKIQGKQFAQLLPQGGSVLYIEGPINSSAARARTAGMMHSKPANIHVKTLRGNWTEESAYRAVGSWLRLRTSQESLFDLVGAQDDSMAAGARKAFAEMAEGERERWLKIPFTGCDGLPKTGQSWVRSGLLTATIYIQPNTDLALEMLTEAIRTGIQPPERRLIVPESVPSIEELTAKTPGTGRQHRSAGV